MSGTLYKDEEKACLLRSPPVLQRCSEAYAAGYWRPDGPTACRCINGCSHCAPGTILNLTNGVYSRYECAAHIKRSLCILPTACIFVICLGFQP